MKLPELWVNIKGYEGLYQISNYGQVKSVPRRGTDGRIIKPSFSGSGYLQTHLCSNGVCKSYLVHRLVALHFIDNPNNYPEVNHKDENKTNNYFENLEFCTRKYNENYGTKKLRSVANHNYKESALKSAAHHNYKIVAEKQAKAVLQFDLNNNFIKRWNSLHDIYRELNYSIGNISRVCNNKLNKVYGYIWKFEEDYQNA